MIPSRTHITFSRQVSLDSSWLWHFLKLPLFLIIWQFWGLPAGYFVDCLSFKVCLMFFSWLDQGYGSLERRPERSSTILNTSSLRALYQGCRLSGWLAAIDVDLHHLAESVCQIFPRWSYPSAHFPWCYSWKEVTMYCPPLRSEELCLISLLKELH